MGLFSKLKRTAMKVAERLRPSSGQAPYRPEKHYMRGAGPKSKRVAPAAGDRTPNTT